ncbi:MAG: HEAT repeat domain-containing protein [Proteobacteria bacterium]|nr:HEAT repeat domain-containing protein [Pseudomonadota bacterium]
MEQAGHSDGRVREQTAFLLGKLGDPRTLDALIAMAHNDDIPVVACQALGKLGQPSIAHATEWLAGED